MRSLPSRRNLITALLMMGLAACSHPAASGSAAPDHPDRNVLTESELPANGAETVYDVIQRLRPDFLRQRPSQSNSRGGVAPSLAVFANGQLLGSLEDLRRVPVSTVKSIRRYSVEEAKQHFGMQYNGGAIELTYRM